MAVIESSLTRDSTLSSHSTPPQNDWLTDYSHQNQPGDKDISRRSSEDASARYGHARRRGNPKLLFMGTRRSGKSSIQKVIFEKFSPAETLYLDPTTRIETATIESFVKVESAELPSNLPFLSPDFDCDALFGSAGAIVWVLDMQDEYLHSINQLIQTATFLLTHYPRLHFEVFVHKSDGLSEEYKYDTSRDVRQRVQDELADSGFGDRGVAFYSTSIFDYSVYEAMSKVIQKLLPQLPALEALLNRLCSACRIQKAYLFDAASKLYLATDVSPTFLRDYEVCSDYVDVILDIKQIYGWQAQDPASNSIRSGRERESNSDDESHAVGESLVTYDRNGNTYIYAREVSEHLSLICVMGQGSTADKRVLIDYNATVLHEALTQMFKL